MNIGILSLKYVSNYGGILQSLALQETIKGMGHSVEIINFQSKKKDSRLYTWIIRLSNLIFSGNVIGLLKEKKKENNKRIGIDSISLINKNEAFMKAFLNRGTPVDEFSIEQYCKKFDCIIVGSDQVWSVTNASMLIYFFDWKFKGKKIAYSACSVNKRPAVLNRGKLKKLLSKFDNISVRDYVTESFVYDLIKQHPLVVADPTFLYNFTPMIGKRLIDERYILVYVLGDEIIGGNQVALELIKKKIASDGEQVKIVSVVIPSVSIVGANYASIVYDDCDPNTWMNLIYYADFVYTDSFHGCVFSMKFNKSFIGYYLYEKRATRLLDLKSRYGLSNIVKNISEINEVIGKSNKKDEINIKEHIHSSIEFIREIIEK